MIVLVTGDPFAPESDYPSLAGVLDAYHQVQRIIELIHSERPGIERLADRWAHEREVATRVFHAPFDLQVGRYLANAAMINYLTKNTVGPTMALLFGERGFPDLQSKVRRAGICSRNYGRCPDSPGVPP